MHAIAHTSAHKSFGSSFAAKVIAKLDYFEFAPDETKMGSVRRDGRWAAFAKAFHQDYDTPGHIPVRSINQTKTVPTQDVLPGSGRKSEGHHSLPRTNTRFVSGF
jgi:hypothetical protein